jgi:hypothetical protein
LIVSNFLAVLAPGANEPYCLLSSSWEFEMRIIATLALALISQVSSAVAQTPEEVKSDILSALSTPMPITVVGPIMTSNVKVTQDGDAFLATLEKPMLMGIIPLGSMSFKLTPAGDKLYRVTDFTLPKTLEVFNQFKVGIGGTTFDGVWSTESRSYRKLNFQLDHISVAPKGSQNSKVEIGSLSLDVAKDGDAGATESKFLLHASDIASKGYPPDNINVKSLTADLRAKGQEPVDLYAVLSRFAVLAATQQGGGDSVLQFAESLRAQKYDKVSLNLSAEGVDVTGTEPGSTDKLAVASIAGTAELSNVTPDDWGSVNITINGKDIHDTGLIDVKQMDADTGSISLTGSQIPIGATLDAIGKLQAISRGEATSLKVSDVLDGLFNIGALKVTTNASGIVYLPLKEEDPTLRIGKYSVETGTEGLRDNKGRLFFSTAVDDFKLDVKKFDTELQKKLTDLLNPKVFHYDLSVSELNESLLRKLMGDVVINDEKDYAALAAPAIAYAMAMKPMIETKDMRYQTADMDMSISGLVRLYPAWALSALPYEGENKISFKGLDKVLALFEDLKNTPPEVVAAPVTTDGSTEAVEPPVPVDNRGTYAVVQSVLLTMKALAKTEGDALTWAIKYPKAGQGLFLVNDTEMRFPDLAGSLGPMIAYGGFLR